jgi:serine/threonine-protein kinase
MVSFEGEVKIIDFGIAKSTTQEESTRVGTLKGKFGYMSPEQVDGMEVDLRTDIFALGIMLWEMLSEQRLFLTNNEMTTLRKIRDCKVPSLREIDPNIPVELEKIVNKALARSKTQRYQSAAELQKDLQSFLNRYNPDFSSHDFSEFIKDLYADEIVEARKRQVAYSKVEMPHISESVRSSSKSGAPETFTQSMTYSKGESEKMNFVDLELKKSEFNMPAEGSHPNLTLSQSAYRAPITTATAPKQPVPMPPPTFRQPMGPGGELTRSHGGSTHTGIRVPTPQDDTTSSPWLGIFIVLIAGAIGVFGLVNETNPRLVSSQCHTVKKFVSFLNCYEGGQRTEASNMPPKLKITSDPAGATIYINNRPSGLKTPSEIDADSTKAFSISVALGGYRTETQKFTSIPLTHTVYFKLSSVPSGVLNVRVIGGKAYMGSQEVVDGQRLTVEAGKTVTFKLVNPFDNSERTQSFVVKPNETKDVVLSPRN